MNIEMTSGSAYETMTTDELIGWVTNGEGRSGSGRKRVQLEYLNGSGQAHIRSW